LLDCLDRATGRLPEPFPAWDLPPQFEVRWSAEFPTTRRETIEAALEHLVRRLAAMLSRAGRGAMRLECRLTCAGKRDGPHLCDDRRCAPVPATGPFRQMGTGYAPGAFSGVELAVGLFRPTAWADHLLQLLLVRLEPLQLPDAVETIRLSAVTAPLELRQQEMFAGNARLQPHHLSGLIDRLSNRLGHTRVARVRLVPDAQPELACHYAPLVGVGWRQRAPSGRPLAGRDGRRRPAKKIKMAGQRCDQPHPTRPLRLLSEPVRLSVEWQQRIARRIGPERIETGWWRGHIVARDYYRVETTAGCWYWIFRRLPDGPWFLHGMFD